jgi:hypothetical protein
LRVYAVDESGCVSPAASFRGIVEGSDGEESVPIESGHSQSHRSLLGETDFYCLSSYLGANFNFVATCGSPSPACAYQSDRGTVFTRGGFATRMRIEGELSDSPEQMALLTFGGVTLNTSLVRFKLTNGAESTKVVDLECDGRLWTGGGNDFYGLGVTWSLGTDRGMYYTWLCRSCPLVRDVSTCWIGSYSNLSDNYWVQGDIESYPDWVQGGL